jgi:outer membrane lipoprotein SlyB
MPNMLWFRLVAAVMTLLLAGCAARTTAPETAPGASPADVSEAEWARVGAMRERTMIDVIVEGSPQVRWWLVSASDSALIVRETRIRSQPETISRASVVQIRAQRPRRLGRGIAGFLLGGLGGAVLGGLVGAAASGDDTSAGLAGVVVGYWAGAITGGIVGANGGWRRPYEVIYVRR